MKSLERLPVTDPLGHGQVWRDFSRLNSRSFIFRDFDRSKSRRDVFGLEASFDKAEHWESGSALFKAQSDKLISEQKGEGRKFADKKFAARKNLLRSANLAQIAKLTQPLSALISFSRAPMLPCRGPLSLSLNNLEAHNLFCSLSVSSMSTPKRLHSSILAGACVNAFMHSSVPAYPDGGRGDFRHREIKNGAPHGHFHTLRRTVLPIRDFTYD